MKILITRDVIAGCSWWPGKCIAVNGEIATARFQSLARRAQYRIFIFRECKLILKSLASLPVFVRSRNDEQSRSYTRVKDDVVCGNTKAKDPNVTFHRIPKETDRGARWLEVFGICDVVKESTRVCCRHFPDGDCSKERALL